MVRQLLQQLSYINADVRQTNSFKSQSLLLDAKYAHKHARTLPVPNSNTRTTRSQEPVTIKLPSRAKQTDDTLCVWLSSVLTSLPVAMFQIWQAQVRLVIVMDIIGNGINDDGNDDSVNTWSQTFAELSSDPETMYFPDGDTSTANTFAVCPVNFCFNL